MSGLAGTGSACTTAAASADMGGGKLSSEAPEPRLCLKRTRSAAYICLRTSQRDRRRACFAAGARKQRRARQHGTLGTDKRPQTNTAKCGTNAPWAKRKTRKQHILTTKPRTACRCRAPPGCTLRPEPWKSCALLPCHSSCLPNAQGQTTPNNRWAGNAAPCVSLEN